MIDKERHGVEQQGQTVEERLDEHVNGDKGRWDVLVWASGVLGVVVVILSVSLLVLLGEVRGLAKTASEVSNKANHAAIIANKNTQKISAATCVLVKTIEEGADRESALVATIKKSLQIPQTDKTRTIRERSLKTHLRSSNALNKLAGQLRDNVDCRPRVGR